MPVWSALLALVAAAAFAMATVLQQSRAHWHAMDAHAEAPSVRRWLPVWGILGRLANDPMWRLGWLVNTLGFGLHAVALHIGPIAVVQSILVVQLLFALMIGDLRRRAKPTGREWLAAAIVCAGVALVVIQRSDAGQRDPAAGRVPVYAVAAAVAVAVLLVAARARSGSVRGVLVGLAAGTCFTVTAVSLTVLTGRLAEMGASGLVHWTTAAILVSTVTGSLLVQDAFASGPLRAPLTAMTVADPLLSAMAGAVLFDIEPPNGVELFVGLPAAGVLIAFGVALLATSPTLTPSMVNA